MLELFKALRVICAPVTKVATQTTPLPTPTIATTYYYFDGKKDLIFLLKVRGLLHISSETT